MWGEGDHDDFRRFILKIFIHVLKVSSFAPMRSHKVLGLGDKKNGEWEERERMCPSIGGKYYTI